MPAKRKRESAPYNLADQKKRASQQARKKAKLEAPVATPPVQLGGSDKTFPAVYGVDLKSRRREKLLAALTK